MIDDNSLDLEPTSEFLIVLGSINLLWARVDAYVSAALFTLLEIDEHDFTILAGRLDAIPKFEKIEQILEHRKDERLQKANDLLFELRKLRPDRNAITHGYYQGKTTVGEHLFFLIADAALDKGKGFVRKMRVFTDQELVDHCNKTVGLLSEIQSVFDSARMSELFGGSFLVKVRK